MNTLIGHGPQVRGLCMGRPARVLLPVLAAAAALAAAPRADADQSPYTPELAYSMDAWRSDGGLDSGTALLHNLDLMLTVDAERAWGLRGGTAFFYVLGTAGDDINAERVGAVQGVDNIEADDSLRLYEAWYEQAFTRGTLRAGLYDLNSEFDSIDTAGLFINPSHGIGPDYSQSGRNGPSIFPVTSLALRYAGRVAASGYWQAALLDGVPGDPDHPRGTHVGFDDGDGALIAFEGGLRSGADAAFRHWGIGAWHYTEKVAEDAAGNAIPDTANQGVYAFAERGFGHGYAAFGRIGIANERINQVGSYVGAGIVRSGIGGRADDRIGLAVAIADMSDDYRAATAGAARETVWELSYRSQINDWLAVQPDIQYFVDPGADPLLDNAVVFGVRFEAAFGG